MKPMILGIHTSAEEDGKLERVLPAKSSEPHIQKFTPKDLRYRFGSFEQISAWFGKGRILYSFWSEDDLAAICWFSTPSHNNKLYVPATFAIRLYAGYAGRGLGSYVMDVSHQSYFEQTSHTAVYLETDDDNLAAKRLYQKFGYEIIAVQGERLTMLYDKEADEKYI